MKNYLIRVNNPRFGSIELIRSAANGRQFLIKRAGKVDCIYKSLEAASGYLETFGRAAGSIKTFGNSKDIPVIDKLPPADIQKIARRIRRYMDKFDYWTLQDAIYANADNSVNTMDLFIALGIYNREASVIEYIEMQIENVKDNPEDREEYIELWNILFKLSPIYRRAAEA